MTAEAFAFLFSERFIEGKEETGLYEYDTVLLLTRTHPHSFFFYKETERRKRGRRERRTHTPQFAS